MNCLTEYLSSLKNKEEIRKNKYIGKKSNEIFNSEKEFSTEDITVLHKKAGKDFVVLNLSDVHFTDYRDIMETAPKRSFPTPLTVARLIRAVKPDLITVTGDIVCGKSTVYSVNNFACLMERFKIPWAPVFGNHDGEGNCDLNYLADVMMKAPHCLMKKGDPALGVGNYTVAVEDENEKIIKAFIMTDGNHHIDGEKNGQPVKLHQEWVKWISDGIKSLSENAEISLFLHIPLPEYIDAYECNFDKEKNKWKDKSMSVGHVGEEIACHMDKDRNPIYTGFFDVLKKAGNVKNVFCGHDHLNAFSLEYEGIRLNYVMKISKSAGRKPGYDGGLAIRFNSNGKTELDYKTVSFGFMRSAYKIKY